MTTCEVCAARIRPGQEYKMWLKEKRKFVVMCQACLDEVHLEAL